MTAADTRLVADIGGTNARFGLVTASNPAPTRVLKLATADYPDLASAARAYAQLADIEMPQQMCVAVAGPVDGPLIRFTNNCWSIAAASLKQQLNLRQLTVINDFEAMAWAVSVLGTEHRVQLGGDGPSAQHQPIAVIGPGTGFGVALLLRNRQGQCHVLATEGGHASLAAVDARELAVHRWLLQQGIFPSREHLLSGRGLERIYRALAGIDQIAVDDLPAHRIQQRAVAGDDALATEALALFCAMLGTAAADQALSCGARGGVYITGGIVRRFIPFLQQSRFRQHFDGQRPMHHYLKPIPVYVVNASHQGLVGAALASQSKRPTAPV